VILVTGCIVARPEHADGLLALSLEHVRRSRTEPGCRSHAVHRDAENPLRFVFVEEWADHAALLAHFAVPASLTFVESATALASEPPVISISDATPWKG
jgi:quinol monooxygenase YgiN